MSRTSLTETEFTLRYHDGVEQSWSSAGSVEQERIMFKDFIVFACRPDLWERDQPECRQIGIRVTSSLRMGAREYWLTKTGAQVTTTYKEFDF